MLCSISHCRVLSFMPYFTTLERRITYRLTLRPIVGPMRILSLISTMTILL